MAQPTARDGQPRPTTAEKVAHTADQTGKVIDVFEAVPEAFSKLDESLKPAAKFARKALWPVDILTSATEAATGYDSDRKRGMAHDDAVVKNFGGMAVKKAGGLVGGAAGSFAGGRSGAIAGTPGGLPGRAIGAGAGAVVGGVTGGWAGEKRAEPYAEKLLPSYHALKRNVRMTTEQAQQFLRSLQVLGTDKYYVDRSAAQRHLTDRRY